MFQSLIAHYFYFRLSKCKIKRWLPGSTSKASVNPKHMVEDKISADKEIKTENFNNVKIEIINQSTKHIKNNLTRQKYE